MNLLEYEAKQILRQYALPVPTGSISDPLPVPVVIKSQVPVGGRGKAGGIQIAHTQAELDQYTREIYSLTIRGHRPNTLLYEELVSISRELYLSLVINRSLSSIELIAHPEGGVDIESHNSQEFFRHSMTDKNFDTIGESLAECYGLTGKEFVLADMVEKLYKCFIGIDATLIEINPLIITDQGNLIAGDCKIVVDNAAIFRHPDWSFEQKPADSNFVVLNRTGTVATIANGAGLAMATVDAVVAKGLLPANFLDVGGSATTNHIVESFNKIMEISTVSAIVINIFGGIVRCDTVAEAIIEAQSKIPELPALYIRLSGNRSHEAKELLAAHGITLYADLDSCLKEIASHGL